MEDVREVLHLYLGQQFVMKITNPMSFDEYTAPMTFEVTALRAAYDKGDNHIDPILVLRRLDSMTEEELNYAPEFTAMQIPVNAGLFTPLEIVWLLSKGFWLFGDSAFDKGLIIDSNTLNKEV